MTPRMTPTITLAGRVANCTSGAACSRLWTNSYRQRTRDPAGEAILQGLGPVAVHLQEGNF